MQFTMTLEHNNLIENHLVELLVRAEAEAVFLCDRGGNILARKNTDSFGHQDNIAALAAGSFFATRELARLIGEPEFQCVFHQGSKTSIYMQATVYDMLLLVVFGRDSNPGLVKLYSEESCRALGDALKKIQSNESQPTTEFELDEHAEIFNRSGNS